MTNEAVQNTVFISYRRANHYMARSVYQSLRENRYDAFLDVESLESGAFGANLINQIRARAHFLVILTPSALERCSDPEDWVRKEIETALDEQRNIIPLMFDGFDFSSAAPYLKGRLAMLRQYNGLPVHEDTFEAAMQTLFTARFLNRSLGTIVHPLAVEEVQRTRAWLNQIESDISPEELNRRRKAERTYERGFAARQANDNNLAIQYYLLSIELYPRYYEAFKSLGMAYAAQQDNLRAMSAYNEAIKLNSNYAEAYHNRALLFRDMRQFDYALNDFNKAIELKPRYAYAYDGRGGVWLVKKRNADAYADFTKAIEFYPDYGFAYWHRARALRNLKSFEQAINDYTEAIRRGHSTAPIYAERAFVYYRLRKIDEAKQDIEAALLQDPNNAAAKKLHDELLKTSIGNPSSLGVHADHSRLKIPKANPASTSRLHIGRPNDGISPRTPGGTQPPNKPSTPKRRPRIHIK